jgi:hypothetical protein
MCLVIVGGLDTTIEATRELKNASRIDVCTKTMRISLREEHLGSTKKVSKLAVFDKNVKETLKFAKMHKVWTACNGGEWFLVMRQGSIIYALMELSDVGFE